MAKTVKDLDLKVNDLKKFFNEELGKFRGEIEKVKTPNADEGVPGGKGTDIEGILLRFNLFEGTVENHMRNLQSQITQLQKDFNIIQSRLDNNLQNSNRSKILLLGVSENVKDDCLRKEIITIINTKLQFSLKDDDVYDCYRLGKKNVNKPRPVVIQFTMISARNEIFHSKRQLKGSGLVIAEVLSPMRYDVFKLAKQKFKKDCWSNNGKIGFKIGNIVRYVSTLEQFLTLTRDLAEVN